MASIRALAAVPALGTAFAEPITLEPLGSYASGEYNRAAAEIVAHDPASQRLFVVNAQTAEIDVLAIAGIAQGPPVKIGSIDLKPFGGGANSVAIRAGLIAVAVEAGIKTDPGKAVFFSTASDFSKPVAPLASVTVGALPDMITFTPNGRFVLVANEGEPNDEYTVDPEGSVSIIDVTGNIRTLSAKNVRTADFRSFNQAQLDPSIRIFGPNATVAQDLEPEYITVSHDSRTAWVTCQEANAVAVVDIGTATVTKLIGLGFKDHAGYTASTTTHDFDPSMMPSIGTTIGGQSITLGGFSGLDFEGIDPVTGRYKFVTHTDRGPNAEPTGILRPFLLPGFAPEVVRFEFDRATGALTLTQRIPLKRPDGTLLTGLPNTAISTSASQPYNDEKPVDLKGNALPLDPLGADLEGIVVLDNGSFWMCDEYRPALYHFNPSGVLIRRVVPVGTAAAAGQPAGTFGEEWLPPVLAQRRQNRGFEALAFDNGKLYVFVQSPLRNPAGASNGTLNANRSVRLVEFDPATNATRQFLYFMDNAASVGPDDTRADKIGDAVSLGNGEFLVVERDDDRLPEDPAATIQKKVYQFNLAGATPINDTADDVLAKQFDQMTIAELAALTPPVRPVEKVLFVDLAAAGYNTTEKVEGLTLIDPWTIAVINDNDFGVARIVVDQSTGTFVREENYTPEPARLGLISVRNNALDASGDGSSSNPSDGKINIRPWPVKGVFMPDAVASYRVGGKTYLVTANEGDAREYGAALNEAVRIGSSSVTLDPAVFPNAAVLKLNPNLGRLNITNTLGRDPSTGFYKELYAFGARSFSIWDGDTGAMVYDSAADLEWITAQAHPTRFNASNSNNTFDNRSDDKGPEPEGVVVGKVFGRDYAFIGLERIGGVVIYDVGNPAAPVFVDYVNNRNFEVPTSVGGKSNPAAGDLGPEGLLFIKADESPTGEPLLVTGNETSGTTTVFAIRRAAP